MLCVRMTENELNKAKENAEQYAATNNSTLQEYAIHALTTYMQLEQQVHAVNSAPHE